MKNVCVCTGCGKTIDKNFVYCPWCGLFIIHNKSEEDDILTSVFELLEQKQADNREQRLRKMEEELDVLENELSAIALSAETRK